MNTKYPVPKAPYENSTPCISAVHIINPPLKVCGGARAYSNIVLYRGFHSISGTVGVTWGNQEP
jgi:hypothetical protein